MKDATLAAGILNGTVDYAVLYNEYEPRVFHCAYVMVRNAEEARDLTSCIMMQVWKKLPGFDPARSTLWTWIRLHARSVIYAHLRKRRLATVSLEDVVDEQEPSCEGPETAYERGAVWRTVDRLREPYRSVLTLRYHDGYSWAEVARMLHTAVRTLQRVAIQGLALLRRKL